ncbi:MAG: Fe-S cluster assembly protein NifU [Candidatus Melainabacteria bacterium RIFOXYA12_FULL_32_12]|nr:MAG: Fe-S cluster assembly protein NifU [Candidatus Melainabacteria bacterium RIFOXYA2_FULL_32_9]OGI30886.1 MAG: Fe-S cluster assembly protein NifU [Candidatus Melainabacteria bacterium RIFOXYA12_FULL_32_12]
MWEYTEKVRDYYRNPKNVGEIENADAIGEVGSISCGDALKLFLKIDKSSGIIIDAKFQTFGCGSAVASAGALTEMIIGKSVEEASKINNQDIADFLGGLPEQKMHCSVMGKEALEAAIENYQGRPAEKIEVGSKIVCKCFGTTEEKIRQIIKENDIVSIAGVTNYCKAGGGCGKCHDDIQEIINDEIQMRETKPEIKPLSKTQMIIKVNNILENYIAAELRKDGGDIELVDVDGNKVFVKLQGSCKNCPSNSLTLKNFVEGVLKEQIDRNIQVFEA